MAFKLMSCPYCGTDIDNDQDQFSVCGRCGKKIYFDRANMFAFIPEGKTHGFFKEAIEHMTEGRVSQAMTIAEELMKSMAGDPNVLMLRGGVHAYEGEDGKAFNDWKAGIAKLENYTNADAYMCFISKSVADLMYYKEMEFIEFDHIRYIDSLSDEFGEFLNGSCKFVMYYTIFVDYIRKIRRVNIEGREDLEDVLPKIIKKMVSYHRDPKNLVNIIDYYLNRLGYVEETHEEDDMTSWRPYYLISNGIKNRLNDLSPEHIDRIQDHWNDENMFELEETINGILKEYGMDGGFHIYKKKDGEDDALKESIDEYLAKYLLLNNEDDLDKE